MPDGTPLPAALDGVEIERVIKIDSALMYLVGGALAFLADRETLEQTGTLTVEIAKNALSAMLECFYECDLMPIGSIQMLAALPIPDKWLWCDGDQYAQADYPELYAQIGNTWGGTAGSGFFNVPDMSDVSPMGVGTIVPVGGAAGAENHTLTVNEMPAHAHTPSNGGSFLVNGGTGTKNHQPFAGTVGLAIAVTNTQGGGGAHNNLSPVKGVIFMIYAGR